MTKDEINKLETIITSKLNITNLTTDEKITLSKYANFSGTPTTLFFTEGEEKTSLNRIVGNEELKTFFYQLYFEAYIPNEYIKDYPKENLIFRIPLLFFLFKTYKACCRSKSKQIIKRPQMTSSTIKFNLF